MFIDLSWFPLLIARSISARALGRRIASALVMTHARLVE